MENRCVFPNCPSSSGGLLRKKADSVTVIPFPKEPTLRVKWLGSIPGIKKRLTSSSGVCSLHFLLRDFNEKDELRPGSIPYDFDAHSDSPKISSLSDLADQLETHPEVIPSHIQHLMSPREYSFYKIRFLSKRPPSVTFSLIIYGDLSFDVSHKARSQGKNFRLKALKGERLTFENIDEVRDVLDELDAIPEAPSSRLQRMEDCVHILSDISERVTPAESHKMEFLMEQIRLLDNSGQKKIFSKKSLNSFKSLLGKIPLSQHKILGNFLTLPESEEPNDDSLKEIKDFCQHFVENADFLHNEEFKSTITSRVAEKDSPVKDVVAKTLAKLMSGNIDEFPLDVCVTVLLLLNEICSLYSLDTTQEEDEEGGLHGKEDEIEVKEEMLGESSPMRDDEDEDEDSAPEPEEVEEDKDPEVEEEEEEEDHDMGVDLLYSNGRFEEIEEEGSLGDVSCDYIIKFSYNCCFCTQKHKSFDDFLKHCADMHYGVDVVLKITPGPVLTIKKSLTEFTCADCKSEYVSLLEMNNHVNFHARNVCRSTRAGKKKVMSCGVCDHECLDKTRLKVHYATNHPTYTIFECKRCSQLFHKCSEYLKHKLYFHKKRAVNPDKLYGCDMCDRKFRFKHYLDKHYAADHHERKYTCDECGRLFDTQRYLTKHKARVHPDSFDYICELCGKKFAINEYLNSHKKICKYRRNVTVAEEDSKLQCNKCYRFFASEVYLNNHKAVVHDKTKAYVCSVCDKHLLSLVNLKLHMATHEENRPKFPCGTCGKEYLNKTTLQFHILTTHEKDKNEKNFKCKLCDWSFWERKNLKNHVKLVHEKVYDHKCDVCGRAFGCRRHLLRHKTTIHDKFREYKCHICSVEYFQKPSLKNHLKKVHNIMDYMPPKLVKVDDDES